MSHSKPSLDDLRIERSGKSESHSRVWIWSLLLAVAFFGAVAWWFTRPGPLAVRTTLLRQLDPSPSGHTVLNSSGYVTARRQATVSSKVTGKVVEVLVEEGMSVKEGQVLARLDDINVKTSLRLAQAQLDAAQKATSETSVRIKEADQELQRQKDLIKNQIATQADYDHAEAAALALRARLQQQEAEVAVAQSQVAYWEQQLDDTIIRAPFSGIVTSKNAQPGEMISPVSAGGGFTRTGICTIVDMQSLEIEIDVSESYINRVESGQSVEAALDAYPEWKIPCKVIAIIPTADRQKSTVKVRVGFVKLDRRILPDMSVKVAFREGSPAGTHSQPGLALPKTALRQENGHDIVFIVRNGRAERRAITVQSSGPDEALVSSGLAPGERVIVSAPPTLKDGAAVKESP